MFGNVLIQSTWTSELHRKQNHQIYEVYEKHVEYLDGGSAPMLCTCKHAFGSSQGLFYL